MGVMWKWLWMGLVLSSSVLYGTCCLLFFVWLLLFFKQSCVVAAWVWCGSDYEWLKGPTPRNVPCDFYLARTKSSVLIFNNFYLCCFVLPLWKSFSFMPIFYFDLSPARRGQTRLGVSMATLDSVSWLQSSLWPLARRRKNIIFVLAIELISARQWLIVLNEWMNDNL